MMAMGVSSMSSLSEGWWANRSGLPGGKDAPEIPRPSDPSPVAPPPERPVPNGPEPVVPGPEVPEPNLPDPMEPGPELASCRSGPRPEPRILSPDGLPDFPSHPHSPDMPWNEKT